MPWSVAQMGWIFGPLSLFGFAVITYITARLLCDCYRTPDPIKGQRNRTYMDAVRATLGELRSKKNATLEFIYLVNLDHYFSWASKSQGKRRC